MSGSPSFSILRESTVYKRYVLHGPTEAPVIDRNSWIKVLDRRVRFPNGKEVAWDVAATSNCKLAPSYHIVR